MGLQRVRHNWVTNTDFSLSPFKALSYLSLWSHVCNGELDCTIPDHPGSLWIWPITPACQGSLWTLTPFNKGCIALSPLRVSLNLNMSSASLFQPQTLCWDKTEWLTHMGIFSFSIGFKHGNLCLSFSKNITALLKLDSYLHTIQFTN